MTGKKADRLRDAHADDTVAPSPGRSRAARRKRVLLAVAAGSALVAVGGLGAATLVKSPAERAARTAPPANSLITAPVTSQVVNQSVPTRGVVYPPTQYNIVPAAASADVTQLYVSKLGVKTGDSVASGKLLAEVSGQPLFALRGPVPAYRDIKPGSNGPDVTELQDALAELGHSSRPDEKGSYGPGTAQAVSDFYRKLGYPVPVTGATTQQAVDTAQKAVDASQKAVDSLTAQKKAGAAPPAAPPGPAQTGAPQTGAPQPGTPQPSAPQTGIPQTGAPAPTAGLDLDRQIADAKKQLTADKAALAKAAAANGPMVPAAHVVFLPTLPAAVTAVNGSVGSPVNGTLLSLTSGGLSLTGQLAPGQAAGVKAGMAVEILVEDTNTTLTGTVAEVGAPTTTPPAGKVITLGGAAAGGGAGAGGTAGGNPGSAGGQPNAPGSGVSYTPITISPTAPLPATLNGKNVRLTVLKDKAGAPVTAVPVAAITTNAAGQTSVTKVDAAGTRTTVPVTTGVTADGMVAVTPAAGTELRPGDQVVVGK
ncbi:peptidoglycan-binding protein [Kitasatospora sp. NPDC087315]|uniref:peptidoglycan-binding domain-containing protein n=1 Tax=Kitasatospora sp. NPDC087315 TaxID=3364069 RepID=UPI00382B2D69